MLFRINRDRSAAFPCLKSGMRSVIVCEEGMMMNRSRSKSILAFTFSLLLVFLRTAPALMAEDKDDKIGDMIEEIERREKERKEKEQEESGGTDNDDEGNCIGPACGSCSENCSADMVSFLLTYASLVEYAPFPYADDIDYDFSTVKNDPEEPRKRWYAKLTFEPAYLLDDIWGLGARAEAAFSVFALNCLYQYNFSQANWFSVFSCNAGFVFPIQNFMLSVFAGGIQLFLPSPVVPRSFMFSFGGSIQIFLPWNTAFEIWTLNAVSETVWCYIISSSVSYAIDRFHIGAGFTYSNYVGIEYVGPIVKVSVWF